MNETIGRRHLLGRAGLALGGAATLGILPSCGDDSGDGQPAPAPQPSATPQVKDYPYAQHLATGYRVDAAAVREAAYHQYYAGGCCHGAYNALLKHLAETAGPPFDLLPLDFGMFGGGGIASYGSICGAVLGGILIVNAVVPNVAAAGAPDAQKNVRNRMMTELMRWYEGFAFPAYTPVNADAAEKGLTKDFSPGNIAGLQVVPGSHLCHASVTGWCAANGNVPANGPDKKARCARLTADVAGKVAEMLNGYLATGTFAGSAANTTTGCVGCHTQAAVGARAPVAAGMECGTCHPTSSHPFPGEPTHDPASSCGSCH
jgi:hypothetical protein